MRRQLKFHLMGDSCAGLPGHRHGLNLGRVVQALFNGRLNADVLCFLGDHIAGYAASRFDLEEQWDWFSKHEFAAVPKVADYVFHIPGNHDCYDTVSHDLYAELFPVSDVSNVVASRDLDYAVLFQGALLVFLNTADHRNNGMARLDVDWLSGVLSSTNDVSPILVFGHHPILPVNGYDEPNRWCVESGPGRQAWKLMKEAGVSAYICSHIIAFDAQVSDGLLQLCSGGAGTEFGPGGAMPGPDEYHHYVTLAVDPERLSFEVFDAEQRMREHLSWPPRLDLPAEVLRLSGTAFSTSSVLLESKRAEIAAVRVRATIAQQAGGAAGGFEISGTSPDRQSSWEITCEIASGCLLFALAGEGTPTRTWRGPAVPKDENCEFDFLIHLFSGQTGVFARLKDHPWSSCTTSHVGSLSDAEIPSHWRCAMPEGSTTTIEFFTET